MDELVGKLNKLNQMMSVRVDDHVKKTAQKIKKSARSRVAVDEGDLKKSIGMRRSKDGLSAVVGPFGKKGSTTKYGVFWRAHFIEWGTVDQPAQPFMTPAYEENKSDYIEGMKKALNKAVDEA